jgi:cystathionine beta-synthase
LTDARTRFLEEEVTKAEDVIKDHIDKPLIVARTEELVSHAIERTAI